MRSRILIVLVVLFGCALSPVKRPWTIELATSGGFAGHGMGTIQVDSDGNINTPCSSKATAEERKRLDAVLATARPDLWRDTYAPENKCCDRFQYDLTLETAGKTYKTNWIDSPEPMPKDLIALNAELLHLLRDHRCEAK